jgi:hypothetical protein
VQCCDVVLQVYLEFQGESLGLGKNLMLLPLESLLQGLIFT